MIPHYKKEQQVIQNQWQFKNVSALHTLCQASKTNIHKAFTVVLVVCAYTACLQLLYVQKG